MTTENKGIFINGKKQIIDMLRAMDGIERTKLLNNIKARNASMGRELSEESFNFSDILKLNDDTLSLVLRHCTAPIIGLAIYPLPSIHQRRILSIMNREGAENAYGIMKQNLNEKKNEVARAQQKILQTAIELSRKNQIRLI